MGERVLLAYTTKGGATEEYAGTIAGTLIAKGFQVDIVNLAKDRKPDISDYPIVILGTGVRMGIVYGKGKKFLKRRDLSGKKLIVYLSSGYAIEQPEVAIEKFLLPLFKKYSVEPFMHTALPGIFPNSKGSAPEVIDEKKAKKWAEALAEKLLQ